MCATSNRYFTVESCPFLPSLITASANSPASASTMAAMSWRTSAGRSSFLLAFAGCFFAALLTVFLLFDFFLIIAQPRYLKCTVYQKAEGAPFERALYR